MVSTADQGMLAVRSRAGTRAAVVGLVALCAACGGRLAPLPQGAGEGPTAGSTPEAAQGAGQVDGAGAAAGSTSGSSQENDAPGPTLSTSPPASLGGEQASPAVADCGTLTPPQVIRICPDGSQGFASYVSVGGVCTLAYSCPSRPLGGCAPQAACTTPGQSCYSTSNVEDAGSISCVCSVAGQFDCALQQPPPPATGCAQGATCQYVPAACMPEQHCSSLASGCGWATQSADGGPACSGSCTCDDTGHLACQSTCDEDSGLPFECAGVTLPNYCDVCLDGTTACAFFTTTTSSVTGHTVCAIETCPPSSAR